MSKKVMVELFMVEDAIFDNIEAATGFAETRSDIRQVPVKISRARLEIDTDLFKRYTTIQPCALAAGMLAAR